MSFVSLIIIWKIVLFGMPCFLVEIQHIDEFPLWFKDHICSKNGTCLFLLVNTSDLVSWKCHTHIQTLHSEVTQFMYKESV